MIDGITAAFWWLVFAVNATFLWGSYPSWQCELVHDKPAECSTSLGYCRQIQFDGTYLEYSALYTKITPCRDHTRSSGANNKTVMGWPDRERSK